MTMQDYRRKLAKQLSYSRRHLEATFWLISELIQLLRWRLLALGLRGILALLCKFAAAGILYVFVDALADDKHHAVEVPIVAWTLPIDRFFLGAMIFGTALMMIATVLHYSIRRTAAKAARKFEENCLRQVFAYASHLPHPKVRIDERLAEKSDMLSLTGYARSCNYLARSIVQLTPTIVSLIACILFLLVLDPMMTMFILMGFLLAIALQYPLTNRAARASQASPSNRRAAMLDVKDFLGKLDLARSQIGPEHAVLEKLFENKGSFAKDMRTYSTRIDAAIQADMVTRLNNHAILAALFIFVGLSILNGSMAWATVALYVAIARIAVKDFQVSGKILSQIGRFFNQVERFMVFIKHVQIVREKTQVNFPVTLQLLDSNDQQLEFLIHSNDVIYCWVPKKLKSSLPLIYIESTSQSAPFVVDKSLLDQKLPMYLNLGLSDEASQERLRQSLLQIHPESAQWPDEWLEISPEDMPDAIRNALILIKLASANISNSHGVFIDIEDFQEISPTGRPHFMGEGPVFVVLQDPVDLELIEDKPIVIANAEKFVALAVKKELRSMTKKHAGSAKARSKAAADDADMLME